MSTPNSLDSQLRSSVPIMLSSPWLCSPAGDKNGLVQVQTDLDLGVSDLFQRCYSYAADKSVTRDACCVQNTSERELRLPAPELIHGTYYLIVAYDIGAQSHYDYSSRSCCFNICGHCWIVVGPDYERNALYLALLSAHQFLPPHVGSTDLHEARNVNKCKPTTNNQQPTYMPRLLVY